MSMEYFGEKLKAARKNKHWNQEEFGSRLDRSAGTISAYETGQKYPSTQTLVKICELLEVSADYLLGLSDNILQQQMAGLSEGVREPFMQLLSEYSRLEGNYLNLPSQDKKHIE